MKVAEKTTGLYFILSVALILAATSQASADSGARSLDSTSGDGGPFDMTGTSVQQPSNTTAPSPAQDVPSAVSLAGTWSVTQSGSMSCDSKGTISLMPPANSAVIGVSNFGGFVGKLDGQLSGSEVTFVTHWRDILGNTDVDYWSGQLADDTNSISGSVKGAWTGRCSFIATRD